MTTESVYAPPAPPRILWRPGVATLALHGLLLAFLAVNWPEDESEVVQVKPVPRVINASLVDMSQFRPKPKPKPQAKPAPKVSKPKPLPVAQKPKPKPAPKVQSKPRVETEPKPKVEAKPEPRLTEAELAALTRSDLARAVEAEDAEFEALTADQLTASYAALIQQTVVGYWSRPPSARNGMEALLAIQLIPTGDVVSVQVLKSSGNMAFDRSAVNAVEKAASFPELKNLPNKEFEKTFRRFQLKFRPEDLRY